MASSDDRAGFLARIKSDDDDIERAAREYLAERYEDWNDPYSSYWTKGNKDIAVGHLVQYARAALARGEEGRGE